MIYNPDCHHRHSIRLPKYDYSQNGQYFVTLCAQNRELWFGEIIDGEMFLNPAGELARAWWLKLPDKFPVRLHEFTIMPNHVHGIIEIGGIVGAVHEPPLPTDESPLCDIRRRMLIPKIVGYFKMNTAKQINQILPIPANHLWQRNYYEHVIRDEQDYWNVINYIKNNPKMWGRDRNNYIKH